MDRRSDKATDGLHQAANGQRANRSTTLAQSIPCVTDDGITLSLQRCVSSTAEFPRPILLVHGAGVRSQIFTPPVPDNLVQLLVASGFDVWNFDWRASIEQAPNHWTLDRAAVFDYPAAVRTIIAHTGCADLQAIVHCQGSTSFMLSLVAGLLPEISRVISNAVSLHPVVPALARLKALYIVPVAARFIPYVNPQWGISAPAGWPKILNYYVRAVHHECNNPVCKWSSFTYGAGFPTLWRHENLSAQVHDWIQGEFAHVPMSFFLQMTNCIRAGHLVTTGEFDSLPDNVVDQAPKTDARIVLIAGSLNQCFKAQSQQRTFDFIDRHAPGRHTYHEFPGYGHLDMFIGKNAPRDVFPLLLDELGRE